MKTQKKYFIILLLTILSFFFLSRRQKQAARHQEEVAKAAAEAGSFNTRVLSYADSMARIDDDPSHILVGGGGRPWLLGTPYPTQEEVERVIGKPSSIDSEGARIWLYKPVPRMDGAGTTAQDGPSKMLELWFDSDDARLQRMTIHKDGETTIGRNGRDYKKHWTYLVPTVPNSGR